jgi:hypothetical protein
MDVNEVLARIRASLSELTLARDAEASAWLGAQLADSVRELDEWLSRGGFLPDEWNYGARNALQNRTEV